MKSLEFITGCLTPNKRHFGKTGFVVSVVSVSLLFLTGCVTSNSTAPLAPAPPTLSTHNTHQDMEHGIMQADQSGAVAAGTNKSMLPPTFAFIYPVGGEVQQAAVLSLSENKPVKRCRIQERFDRKALIAYHWDRSRLALDVDGLNLGGGDAKQIKLEYRLRLQPEKTRKEKCLYESSWQGLIGSGYNEFFVREDDTVWQELREMRKKALRYIDDNL